jgi:hypothetical protein
VLKNSGILNVRIDSYQFGSIMIGGITYDSDCLILAGTVLADWRRKQGHVLSTEDLQAVLVAKPKLLIVGCGASGQMKVAKDVPQFLSEHGIKLQAFDTYQAVKHFNEITQTDENVAAALHLTC